MNNDLRMEQFKYNLIRLINESQLNVGSVYYIFKDVYADVASEYDKAIQQALKEQEEAQKAASAESPSIEEMVQDAVAETIQNEDN